MEFIHIRPGGLMRCCELSIAEDTAARDVPPAEGDVLPCRYCHSKARFHDGAWEWIPEPWKD